MKVYAYFDDCCQTAAVSPTLELWRRSWHMAGWQPVVLTEDDAREHPLYPEFSDAV